MFTSSKPDRHKNDLGRDSWVGLKISLTFLFYSRNTIQLLLLPLWCFSFYLDEVIGQGSIQLGPILGPWQLRFTHPPDFLHIRKVKRKMSKVDKKKHRKRKHSACEAENFTKSHISVGPKILQLQSSLNPQKQQQGIITNTLALPIDKMLLYIYLLCPHSEDPKNSIPI